jgi:adenine-specific DNA-methyltransferase
MDSVDNSEYYTDQIITYMGNKRKVITHIEPIINQLKEILGKDKLTIGEGFSGSGIVSRLFKNHASAIHINDLAGYSKTINKCYLANPDKKTIDTINTYIQQANLFVSSDKNCETKFIQLHWSPKTDIIKKEERVYYTKENGRRIDCYQEYIINHVPEEYRHYLLAPLLVEASKHNNCSGNFAAFYKKDDIGHFGGKNENDIKRITQNIELPFPLFSVNKCDVNIYQKDVNEWVKEIPDLDLVYYDPPYNKHPYHIYYFLLDLINNWDITVEIPNTFRGQPKNWQASLYNSHSKAKTTFDSLIKNTRAKYILVSYNNEGIINEKEMKEILSKYGQVTEKLIEHSTYNRMKGIAEYKKNPDKEVAKIKECLYLLQRH